MSMSSCLAPLHAAVATGGAGADEEPEAARASPLSVAGAACSPAHVHPAHLPVWQV